jgi:hypothetical protein
MTADSIHLIVLAAWLLPVAYVVWRVFPIKDREKP